MPKIIQAFTPGRDPLANMLTRLGQQMFGDKTGSALRGEQLYALQRKNTEIDALGKMIAEVGASALAGDPTAQARLFSSGVKPGNFADLSLLDAATRHGAADSRTQNAQVGAGQSYRNTAGAHGAELDVTRRGQDIASSDRRYDTDQTIAESQRQFNEKPMPVLGPDARPIFEHQNKLVGSDRQPILSETEVKGTIAGSRFDDMDDMSPAQKAYLGADGSSKSGTPRNYRSPDGRTYITYDGVTDAQTGQPLPTGGYMANVEGGAEETGLTNSVNTDLQSDVASGDRFMRVSNKLLELTNDPTLFGLLGNVRAKGQEAAQMVGALNALFADDGGVAAAMQEARADLNAQGLGALIPEIYNPDLPRVQMLGGLMLYLGASALAGQENRSVSDKDIAMMKRIMGDPHGMFESHISIAEKIKLAQEVVAGDRAAALEMLERGTVMPDDAGGPAPEPGKPYDVPPTVENALDEARAVLQKRPDLRDQVIQRLQQAFPTWDGSGL